MCGRALGGASNNCVDGLHRVGRGWESNSLGGAAVWVGCIPVQLAAVSYPTVW